MSSFEQKLSELRDKAPDLARMLSKAPSEAEVDALFRVFESRGAAISAGAPRSLDDTEILERIRHGDASAVDELTNRCLEYLSRWGHGRLPAWARPRASTADLVQNVLIKVVRRLNTFEPAHEGGLRAYLRKAFANAVRDEIRHVRKRPQQPLDDVIDPEDDSPTPVRSLIARAAWERVRDGLERLSERDHVLIEQHLDGTPMAEIARSVGLADEGAARVALHRALKRLRKQFPEFERR